MDATVDFVGIAVALEVWNWFTRPTRPEKRVSETKDWTESWTERESCDLWDGKLRQTVVSALRGRPLSLSDVLD